MLLSGASAAPIPVAPAPAPLDLAQEAADVGDHLLGRLAGQHVLEVALGQLVLALEVEGARELEPHPHQARLLDQHGVEGANGLVQQRHAVLVGHLRVLRRAERREAVKEERVGLDHVARNERPQDVQRLGEAAGVDQRPRLVHPFRGRHRRPGRGGLVGRVVRVARFSGVGRLGRSGGVGSVGCIGRIVRIDHDDRRGLLGRDRRRGRVCRRPGRQHKQETGGGRDGAAQRRERHCGPLSVAAGPELESRSECS